ncbi:MAG: hypothetical protein BWY82_02749 [Verrucomicrobia bacterium ADurb.Bin474]|nr:MAG: hypothetical protein BWY82_02749 [Verrucomicrobia bacterium ADurb.Bin474]
MQLDRSFWRQRSFDQTPILSRRLDLGKRFLSHPKGCKQRIDLPGDALIEDGNTAWIDPMIAPQCMVVSHRKDRSPILPKELKRGCQQLLRIRKGLQCAECGQ